MSTTIETSVASFGLERQERYVAEQDARGENALIVEGAFVRGIRDLGYQNTPRAIDELIDNSVQARASKVHVWFGSRGANVTSYAVIDDGFGMIPKMLTYAAKWGGTDREGDRKGLGRYGYGLPSSCVSQGKRFRIFSRVEGGPLMCVSVDLENLRAGEEGRILAPEPEEATFPTEVAAYIESAFGTFAHGTVVLVDKLDRLTWSRKEALKKHLLEHVGLIYRNYLPDRNFIVGGTEVEPTDPLFLTPGARHMNVDEEKAIPYEPMSIVMKTISGEKAVVGVRVALLPLRFGYVDKTTTLRTKAMNGRMHVMGEHEGLIVLRMGRQMEVVTRHPWGAAEDESEEGSSGSRRASSWRAEDRYWQIELDFPAELDEKFSVTTSKQSVRLNDSVWDALEEAGIQRLISDMKKRSKEEGALIKTRAERDSEEKRASEQAMENAAEFKGTRSTVEQNAAAERHDERVVVEARQRVDQTGLPFEEVKVKLQEELVRRPFLICEEANVGAPFYRPEGVGSQIRVYLNTTHPFFTDLYAGSQSTPETRSALEVMLFVMAGEEVNAMDRRLEFYERERSRWSDELRTSLRELTRVLPAVAAAGVGV